MTIGAGLVLIAVGAILRFGISTVSTHGIAVHVIGDILMAVGGVGSLGPQPARGLPAARTAG